MEGGVWLCSGGFLVYVYLIYEGSSVKCDVLEVEYVYIV